MGKFVEKKARYCLAPHPDLKRINRPAMKPVSWYQQRALKETHDEAFLPDKVLKEAYEVGNSILDQLDEMLKEAPEKTGREPKSKKGSVCIMPIGRTRSQMGLSVVESEDEFAVVIPVTRVAFAFQMSLLLHRPPDYPTDLSRSAHLMRLTNALGKYAIVGSSCLEQKGTRDDPGKLPEEFDETCLLRLFLGEWDQSHTEMGWRALRGFICGLRDKHRTVGASGSYGYSPELFDSMLRYPILHELCHVFSSHGKYRKLFEISDLKNIVSYKVIHHVEIDADLFALSYILKKIFGNKQPQPDPMGKLQDFLVSMVLNYSLMLVDFAARQGKSFIIGVPPFEASKRTRYPRPEVRLMLVWRSLIKMTGDTKFLNAFELGFIRNIDYLSHELGMDSMRLVGCVIPAMNACSSLEHEPYTKVTEMVQEMRRAKHDS